MRLTNWWARSGLKSFTSQTNTGLTGRNPVGCRGISFRCARRRGRSLCIFRGWDCLSRPARIALARLILRRRMAIRFQIRIVCTGMCRLLRLPVGAVTPPDPEIREAEFVTKVENGVFELTKNSNAPPNIGTANPFPINGQVKTILAFAQTNR